MNRARVHLKGEAKKDGLPLTVTVIGCRPLVPVLEGKTSTKQPCLPCGVTPVRALAAPVPGKDSYLVDPASSHMLVSKIKPCMSKYKH